MKLSVFYAAAVSLLAVICVDCHNHGRSVVPHISSRAEQCRSTVYAEALCESKHKLNIECAEGHVINVIKANYGRTSLEFCKNKNWESWPVDCQSEKALQVLNDSCNGQRSCNMKINKKIFGPDPCKGVTKYLEVHYACEPDCEPGHHREYVCEHLELNIECKVGHVINVIQANFGRTSKSICNPKGKQNWPENCKSEKSLQELTARCTGQRSCKVSASSSIFGETPCNQAIPKYLEVDYACEPVLGPGCDPACQNGAMCNDANKCECLSGWTGDACDIIVPDGCPEGFFKTENSPQCFRLYDDTKRSWDEANKKCEEQGLRLAHPQDPVSVRSYIMENLGVRAKTWIGARGNGTHQVWQNGEVLSNTSPYWWDWWTVWVSSFRVSSQMCLTLASYPWLRTPGLAYDIALCSTPGPFRMTLCELPMDCPEGSFRTGRSHQCFKLFQDVERNWTEAKENCEANDMILAEPQDPVAVNAYLVEHFGTKHWTWIGARATASSFTWQHSGEELSNTSPYWMWQPISSNFSTSYSSLYCLGLLSIDYWQPYHCDTPYNMNFCSTRFWSLCEHKCTETQFECTNKKCVSSSSKCNGNDDCGDNSDEEYCDTNECNDNNGGCSQNCHDTKESFSCSCDSGYSLNEDGKTCHPTTGTNNPQPTLCERFLDNAVPLPTIHENDNEIEFTPGLPFTEEEIQSALLNTTVPDNPNHLPCSAVFPLTDLSNRGVLSPNWPNAEIPYEIDENLSGEQRQFIIKAIQEVQEKTCLHFPAKNNHTNWMRIQINSAGCYVDSLGVPTSKPYVRMNLQPNGCFYHGIIVHEILHVAGLAHEQTRFDRDNFVNINWENIREGDGFTYQFCKRKTLDTGHPYDYESVMHYGSYAFSKQRFVLETIDAKGNAIGQRAGMSKGDVEQINHLYCN